MKNTIPILLCLLVTIVPMASCKVQPGTKETIIDSAHFGVKADGQTDDAPAIQRMLLRAASTEGPVLLRFPKDSTIRISTAPDRYLFKLDGVNDFTVDGGGSTFLLAPDIRFLNLRHSRNITFGHLNIDFSPLPFADGVVESIDLEESYMNIRLMPWVKTPPSGTPTREDGEQAFFSMLWREGPYGLVSRHVWVKLMEPGDEPCMVRLYNVTDFSDAFNKPGGRIFKIDELKDMRPGQWKISMPIPGIAHRYGPGGCIDIFDNDTVTFHDVELWSAPWFGFRVFRNKGEVSFKRVHIRPKPGSGRLTSTWRDGFHVKGNSGKLLWEDCILEGMNDDAFNISTHSSRVTKVITPAEIVVQQTYRLNIMPWHVGATLGGADYESKTLLGEAKILKVTNSPEIFDEKGRRRASKVTLLLDRSIEGMAKGMTIWEVESSNPDTTLRRCRILKSCRMQCAMTLEDCQVTALMSFRAEEIEGPFPVNLVIRNCVFKRGRGNRRLAVIFYGPTEDERKGRRSAIHDVIFENNEVWGDFLMQGVDDARLWGNKFLEPGAKKTITGCRNLNQAAKQ